jgi:hypothetical protein
MVKSNPYNNINNMSTPAGKSPAAPTSLFSPGGFQMMEYINQALVKIHLFQQKQQQSAAARKTKEKATIEAPRFFHLILWPSNSNKSRRRKRNSDTLRFPVLDWSLVFAQAGAQYVVLTSKHQDGFCMWDSAESGPTTWQWNVMDVGPRRDLLGNWPVSLEHC